MSTIGEWTCQGGDLNNPSECKLCGNGLIEFDEVCDDGKRYDSIGCSYDCMGTLSSWFCENGTSTTPDVCVPICGDGIWTIFEQCDDGDQILYGVPLELSNGNGCDQNCFIE